MKNYGGSVPAKIEDKIGKYSKISGWPPKIITKATQLSKLCSSILAHLLTKLKTKESNLEIPNNVSNLAVYVYANQL